MVSESCPVCLDIIYPLKDRRKCISFECSGMCERCCMLIQDTCPVCLKKQENARKYKWAFIGTPHKSSRHDILFQFSSIKPSFCHKTNKFNEKIIDTNQMSEILSSTDFIPCPNGFFHPETYRLYEALECECIPIVENAFRYYDRLFPNNPFIKVDKWIEAKSMIKEWDREQIKKKRKSVYLGGNNIKANFKKIYLIKLIHE